MPKDGLGPSGRKLWTAVTAGCEVDEHERVFVACRVSDT
jgi:hypothetical protein